MLFLCFDSFHGFSLQKGVLPRELINKICASVALTDFGGLSRFNNIIIVDVFK